MKQTIFRLARIALLVSACSVLASCEPPAVYGSVGYSSYSGGGYHGGGGYGTSVRVGGRIY
jgi:hypothetical protein